MSATTRPLWVLLSVLAALAPPARAEPVVDVGQVRSEPAAAETEEQPAAEPRPAPQTIVLRDYLVLPRVGEYGRRLVALDPIDAALISSQWKAPQHGDQVVASDGKTVPWRKLTCNEQGVIETPDARGGYAHATVDSPADKVWLLHAQRHAAVRVNGRWLTGDPYGLGWFRLPVKLKQGGNELLFHLAQPGFRAELTEPPGPVAFLAEDAVLPDVVASQDAELWASVTLVNATDAPVKGARLLVAIDGGEPIVTPLPMLPALAVHKARFSFRPPDAHGESVALSLTVSLPEGDGYQEVARTDYTLSRVQPGQPHKRTFVSEIDGSIQPYTLVPCVDAEQDDQQPGLILALHGLGVDHTEFAQRYAAKSWAHIVVPQGRGGFDFDWEDWAAADALEALADAQAQLPHDPRRTFVTGHSMGGHGAWRLGVTAPDRFAAIGPSAGWVSHWTYGGGMPAFEDPTPIQAMLLRAAEPSDTAKLAGNLAGLGVYVLHGQQDQMVGVSQSRYMRERLGAFHPDFAYLERRGAGNWWGDACCDWPAMMDFFRSRRTPDLSDVRRVDFVTPNPALSASCHWARVEAQDSPGAFSRVQLRLNRKASLFSGTTENVKRMSLDASFLRKSQPIRVQLDGERALTANPTREKRVWLSRNDRGQWKQVPPPPGGKHANRHGTFKAAFDNNALLVYGAAGNEEENAWAAAKANFDAQNFWGRGAGALEVIPDTQFDASEARDRNVVLYGNSETNRAWPALLSTCPIQVRGARVNVSSLGVVRPEEGGDLATLFVYPRPGSERALVAVVGGAGIKGMRLTDRMRYFKSGVHLPDFMLIGADAATDGDAEVRAAGYFGHDWRVETGQIDWRDTAL